MLIKRSKDNTVCVLVHLSPKDPTAAMNVTSTSRTTDYNLVPIARSYLNRKWEPVAGPYAHLVKVKKCNKRRCTVKVPPRPAHYPNDGFHLMTFDNTKTFDEKLSRFFSQVTFGPTSDMISGWSYTKDDAGMAQYVKDQTLLPSTSLRETYRKGADFSLKDKTVGTAAVPPRHPCAQYSRWRDYIFTGDDYGKAFKVTNFSGKYLLTVDGMVRGVVSDFKSSDSANTLKGAGDYEYGKLKGLDFFV